MKNETLDYGIRAANTSAASDANPWLPSSGGETIASSIKTGLRMNLVLAAWAVSALTAPITYSDPTSEFRRSGTSTLFWAVQTKRRKRLSLTEAWKQVRRVFDEAEGFRVQQRAMDARDLGDIVSNETL